jgi:hypothetical protein
MQAEAAKGQMGAMLSFTRLSFNYFMSETVLDYILDAIHLVAAEGWKLMPLYRFDPSTGLWRHLGAGPHDARISLHEALASTPAPPATAPESILVDQLEAARRVIAAIETYPPTNRFSP